MLILAQTQIKAHPVHRFRWYYWNWTVLGYWVCSHTCRPSLRPPRLLLYWHCSLRYDAVLGRDGNLAASTWSNSSVLRQICRRCFGICSWMECKYRSSFRPFRSPKTGELQDPHKTTKLTRILHRTGMLLQSHCVPKFQQLQSLSNIGLELMAFPWRYGSQSSS